MLAGGPHAPVNVPGGALSKGQIARIWSQANRGQGDPRLMAAIALAESSGNPSAVGNDPGGTQGLGLWQITTGFNDDLIAKYGGRNAMFNPLMNAKAAGDILARQGLGAWVVYNTGAYQKYMQRGGPVAPMPGFSGLRGDAKRLARRLRDPDLFENAAQRRAWEQQLEWTKQLIQAIRELRSEVKEANRNARDEARVSRSEIVRGIADVLGDELGVRAELRGQGVQGLARSY